MNFRKGMVFPTSEEMKKDINRSFEVMTDRFNFKRATSIFKGFQKDTLCLWEKLVQLNDTTPEWVQAIDFKVFLERESLDTNSLKEYLIISIPILLPDFEQVIIDACDWLY